MSLPINATADQNLVRKFNTAVVLDILRRQAPVSRAEVAAWTGLNRSTISSIVNGLLSEGLVQETNLQSDRVGRPGMLLELNPAGGFAVGVELGVDFISVIVTDFVAHVLWRQRVDSDPGDGQLKILERAFELTQIALDEGPPRNLRPLGIGVGVPGLVDLREGMLRLAPNLASEILLPIVERVVAANALGIVSEDVKIIPSTHGTEACVMGAVALVLDDILREPTFA